MLYHSGFYLIFDYFFNVFRLESEGKAFNGHILRSIVHFSARLTLGGGMGLLGGEHGLAIDNLIKVVFTC